MQKANKDTDGKLDTNLLYEDFYYALMEVNKVLHDTAYKDYGDNKKPYGPGNWKLGINDESFNYNLKAAIKRHDGKRIENVLRDHKSGHMHRAHSIANQLILLSFELKRELEDSSANDEDVNNIATNHSILFDNYDNEQLDREFVQSDDTQETVQYKLPEESGFKNSIYRWGPDIPSYVNYLALTNLHELVGSSEPFGLHTDSDCVTKNVSGWRPPIDKFEFYLPRDMFYLWDVFNGAKLPYWKTSYEKRPQYGE